MKRLVLTLVLLCAGAPVAGMVGCGDDEASDEDAIEKFIEDITGPVNAAYVQRALGYLDTKSFPIDVMVPGRQGVYDEAATPKLVDGFRKAMTGRFNGAKVRIRSKKYEITGDSAEVTLNLLSKAFGMARWEFTLRKRSDGAWKVSRLHVIR